jgi:hypothetical protein
MKTSKISSYKETVSTAGHPASGWLAAGLVVIIGLSSATGICWAQPSDGAVPGAQVLTRGPVHEAFAGMVTFNPEPGIVISKAPPELIEEMPPEERPEGDNVAWIPGYWGWDDERSDFLWVSGTWRALPPGREWMAGYWGETSQGYQWISGYWADASVRETTYLPPPPQTVEVGPNIAAPSLDYGWSPGCWVWYQGRYAWQPGYWAQGRADWDWMPSHYVWTPRGYIFVGGYWDYPVQRRGIVFAPVYFESSYYARRGYVYSPSIVISLGVFTDHLFLRPSYSHYYFGDYYAPSYYQGGFYASFSFQSSRHGYDPFYSRQRWTHRRDRDWERRTETSYQYRRDHEAARPPRTYAAQSSISVSVSATERSQMLVAAPIEQVAKRTEGGMRFQSVAKAERQQLAVRGKEVQRSREQRRTLEAKGEAPTARKSGETFQPTKVEMPRSPIVAKPVKELSRNQEPPEMQKAPKPDLKRQPKSEPAGRPQNVERTKTQPELSQPDAGRKSAPQREQVTPREKQVQPKPERRPEQPARPAPAAAPRNDRKLERAAPAEAQPRANNSPGNPAEDSQRKARGVEKKAGPEAETRANDSNAKAREASQQNVRRAEQQQAESARQQRDAAVKSAEESNRNAKALEKKAQSESEQRTKDSTARAREESQRNTRAAEQKNQQDSAQRAKDAAGRAQADAPREARGQEKQVRPEPEQRSKAPVVKAREEPATKRSAVPGEKGGSRLLEKESKKQGGRP